MVRTLNTTTGNYEPTPIRDYSRNTNTNEVAKLKDLLAQCKAAKSIVQVRKLLA